MTTTYTTATIVRKRIEDIDTTLLDADIDQYINEAETIIDCIMKHSLKQTFNAQTHAIVRGLTTDMAALSCLQYNQDNFTSPHLSESYSFPDSGLMKSVIESNSPAFCNPRNSSLSPHIVQTTAHGVKSWLISCDNLA